ncbi:MAG TPA: hypothetical protein VKD67_06310, partial [Acidimicrobiales bacterium]|nr:hypothetical protein [Acidimicrobiales bacterium]
MSSGPPPSWAAPEPGQQATGPPEPTPPAPPRRPGPWGWITLAVVVLVAGLATWLAVRDDSGGSSVPAGPTAKPTAATSAATSAARPP